MASWMATEGHAKTLKIFCDESKTEYNEIEEKNVVERKGNDQFIMSIFEMFGIINIAICETLLGSVSKWFCQICRS